MHHLTWITWGSIRPFYMIALYAIIAPTSVGLSDEQLSSDLHPELKRLSPTHDVWIDLTKKEVVVGGSVCLDTGPIEYFACPKDTKDYESLVAVRSPARFVHAGLLAIGLKPGAPVSFNPEYTAASGPIVEIQMRWKDTSGKRMTQRAQEWVRDTRTGKAMTEQWVFAGSSFWLDPVDQKEYYQADGGDLVCLSNFPTAMLDLPIPSSQSNAALLFEAFDGCVPPMDTQVELVFSPQKR